MVKYSVYTDAATRHDASKSSISFLVLSEDTYIHSAKEYCAYSNTAHAESVALGKALKYIVNVVQPEDDDEVEVNCDSLYVIRWARSCRSAVINNDYEQQISNKPTKAVWLEDIYSAIIKLNCKLKFNKVKGHGVEMNPHCYVDRLAKTGLTDNVAE